MNKEKQALIREWLTEKFKQRGRGAQAELAEYLALDKNAVSKMVNAQSGRGYRAIRADELIKMANFFGKLPPGLPEEKICAARDEIAALFDRIPPEQQQIILSLLKSLVSSARKN